MIENFEKTIRFLFDCFRIYNQKMNFLIRLNNALIKFDNFLIENFDFDQNLIEILNQIRSETISLNIYQTYDFSAIDITFCQNE